MYFFYIDETGNRDLSNDRFYVLTAVGMFEGRWKRFHYHIENVKESLRGQIQARTGLQLGLADCEVKSNWVRNSKARKTSAFLSNLTDEELKMLIEQYYRQLEYHHIKIVSVVLDKTMISDPINDSQKLHNKAWELLCERIENYMREFHLKHNAILITDDTGIQQNEFLASKHASLYRRGTSASVRLSHILEMPLFVRSELSEGVQLADLCSYNVYRAFKDDAPEYVFFKRILPFFYISHNTADEKIDGLKVFPERSSAVKLLQKKLRPLTGVNDVRRG